MAVAPSPIWFFVRYVELVQSVPSYLVYLGHWGTIDASQLYMALDCDLGASMVFLRSTELWACLTGLLTISPFFLYAVLSHWLWRCVFSAELCCGTLFGHARPPGMRGYHSYGMLSYGVLPCFGLASFVSAHLFGWGVGEVLL